VGSFSKRVGSERARRERQDAEDAKEFPRKEPCHDCAFRPDSPEREDPVLWDALLRQTDPEIGMPFYCHFDHDDNEMPTDRAGNYNPPRRPDGRPIGYPMCAGWVRTFDVKLERLRKKEA
jgi:hypothetical protein